MYKVIAWADPYATDFNVNSSIYHIFSEKFEKIPEDETIYNLTNNAKVKLAKNNTTNIIVHNGEKQKEVNQEIPWSSLKVVSTAEVSDADVSKTEVFKDEFTSLHVSVIEVSTDIVDRELSNENLIKMAAKEELGVLFTGLDCKGKTVIVGDLKTIDFGLKVSYGTSLDNVCEDLAINAYSPLEAQQCVQCGVIERTIQLYEQVGQYYGINCGCREVFVRDNIDQFLSTGIHIDQYIADKFVQEGVATKINEHVLGIPLVTDTNMEHSHIRQDINLIKANGEIPKGSGIISTYTVKKGLSCNITRLGAKMTTYYYNPSSKKEA